MWSTFALLVFLSLGISTVYSAPDANSDVEIQKFLDRMARSIASKDRAVIAGLFEPDFFFKGCKGDYTKEKVIGILSSLPKDSKFSVSLKSSEYVGEVQIKYHVSVNGFGASPVVAEFIFNRNDQQLESGNVPACMKPRVVRDDVFTTVTTFLNRMIRDLGSQDETVITGLFQPGFIMKGCKGTYDRKKIVDLLVHLPRNTTYRIKLAEDPKDQGSSIKFVAKLIGFDKLDIVAQFILNKKDLQLESGNVPKCQKNKKTVKRMARGPGSDAISLKFLEEFKKSVLGAYKYKNAVPLEKLFDDKFEIKGCKGTYDKDASIAQLRRMDTENPFDFEFHSSHFNKKGQIVINTSIYGVWDDFTADLVYCPVRNQLLSGEYTSCKKETKTKMSREIY